MYITWTRYLRFKRVCECGWCPYSMYVHMRFKMHLTLRMYVCMYVRMLVPLVGS